MLHGSASRLVLASFLTIGLLFGNGCSCGGNGAQHDAAPQVDVAPQVDAQEDMFVRPDGYLPDGFVQPDGYIPDGGSPVHIEEVVPPAVSRIQDNDVDVIGSGFQSGCWVILTNCDDPAITYRFDCGTVSAEGDVATITIPTDLAREQGLYSVDLYNPDGSFGHLECTLWISAQAPPTVTDVKPASASRGDPADGISSDQAVTIIGTGFQSTPNVRWQELATGDLYDAKIVGFVSDTQLTALCPSESKHMPAGDYHVLVINPDLLGATWMVNGTTPGIFKIMALPPPRIDAVEPQSFPGADCAATDLTVTGANFVAGASGTTFWIVMPAQTGCTNGKFDANGNWVCPITGTATDATHATINLAPNCPTNGPYPIEAENPDGQTGFYYFIVLTPSSDCHMQAAGNDWNAAAGLQTGRYLFASATGCDEFGHAFIYAAGGLDGTNAIIDSVEFSEVNIYGVPGPWSQALQYLDADNPRVVNTLGGLSNPAGRSGLTVVRVGRHLYAIAGAPANSNVDPGTTQVTALNTVEHAFILGYETMPMAHVPTVQGTGGLPPGSWYYRVSAIGSFGEGLASDEVVLLNEGGTLKVCWTVPPAPTVATAFNIYRTRASDGRSRSETLVAAGVPGEASGIDQIKCFIDDGFGALTPAPGRLRGAPVTGAGTGTLAAATYRYRVSATIDDGTLPAFETLAGYEAAIELTAADVTAGRTSIELHWDPVQYVAAYNLYKWDATAQKFVLFAQTADGSTLTLTDDGTTPTATCPVGRTDTPCAALEGLEPLPPGSLSTWSTAGMLPLNDAREGLDGVPIIYEDDADPTLKRYFLIVAGGRSDNALGTGSFLSSVESVEVDATDGHMIDAGGGGWVQETQTMTAARAFFPLVTNQGRQDPTFCPPAAQPPCQDFDGDGFYDCACASDEQQPCDCDDTDATVHPGPTTDPPYTEVGKCSNGKDDDCDGLVDCADTADCATDPVCGTCTEDLDGDGYVSAAVCGANDCCDSGTENSLGCDPSTAASIHPGAVEICGDGIDQNCDGVDDPCQCDTDADGDGHISIACGGDDCCDSGTEGNDFFSGTGTIGCNPTNAPTIYPGNYDPCGDSIDQNCDGWDSLCGRAGTSRARASSPAVVQGPMSLMPSALRAQAGIRLAKRPTPTALPKLYGSDQRVWLVAAQGLTTLISGSNAGTTKLEACELAQTNAPAAGSLLIECDPVSVTTPNLWAVQVNEPPHQSYGHEVLLYGQNPNVTDPTVSCLYNFAGVQSQTLGAAPSPRNATEPRFPVYTALNYPGFDGNQTYLLGEQKQGGAPVPTIRRAYYQMVRLNGYVYVIGGHTGSTATPAVERIQQ